MVGFDEAVPSMTDILGQPQTEPAAQQTGMAETLQPGIMSQIQGGLQSNPMLAGALLHTMMSLAAGHDMGTAIANGGRAALMSQAQAKVDQQLAQRNAVADRKAAADEKRANAAETRANAEVNLGQQKVDIARKAEERAGRYTDANVNLTNAQAAGVTQKMQQSGAMFGLDLERARADISRIQQQIADSKDANQTNALNRQLMQAKLKYADAMYQSELEGKQANTKGQQLSNEKAALVNEDYASAPAEMRQAAATGTSKAPQKSEADYFQEFVKQNPDAYIVLGKDGKPSLDLARAEQDFVRVRSVGQPTRPNPQGDAQAQYDAAFNAAKPGDVFRVNGKIYRKPAK